MKLAFLTNQPAYHSIEFGQALSRELGVENFRLIFDTAIKRHRADMGWRDSYQQPFILRTWESPAQQTEAQDWINNAEVVVQGRFPIRGLRSRLRANKLTFAYQERLWKKPATLRRKITRFPYLYRDYFSNDHANYHLLAIGSQAAHDLHGLGVFLDRSWVSGYFIDCPTDCPIKSPIGSSLNLLWCGRFIHFKQPQIAIDIVAGLRQAGASINLTMIGDGPLRPEVGQAISRHGLSDIVRIIGYQDRAQINKYMCNAELFLMTSHRGEGWGIVVNEAVGNGCCVLANRDAGSAQWLIEDGKTGYLYTPSNLAEVVQHIATHKRDQLISMGRLGHQLIAEQWSATTAAKRLLNLCEPLLMNDMSTARDLYQSGPCAYIAQR